MFADWRNATAEVPTLLTVQTSANKRDVIAKPVPIPSSVTTNAKHRDVTAVQLWFQQFAPLNAGNEGVEIQNAGKKEYLLLAYQFADKLTAWKIVDDLHFS